MTVLVLFWIAPRSFYVVGILSNILVNAQDNTSRKSKCRTIIEHYKRCKLELVLIKCFEFNCGLLPWWLSSCQLLRTGSKGMKASAAYPACFAKALIRHHKDHMVRAPDKAYTLHTCTTHLYNSRWVLGSRRHIVNYLLNLW